MEQLLPEKPFFNWSILDKIREVPDVSIFRDATKQITTMLLGGEQLFCTETVAQLKVTPVSHVQGGD